MPDSARETEATTDQAQGVYDYYPSGPQFQRAHHPSLWSSMSREFVQEAEEAKAVLLQAGRSLLTELVRKAVPEIARSLGVNLSSQFEKQKDSPSRRPPSPLGGSVRAHRSTNLRGPYNCADPFSSSYGSNHTDRGSRVRTGYGS